MEKSNSKFRKTFKNFKKLLIFFSLVFILPPFCFKVFKSESKILDLSLLSKKELERITFKTNQSGALFDPWLNGFPYRRAIGVTNSGSALSNYQVLVTLDTSSLISAGKMRSDCGDIRFTDSDGITQLNYWIESECNSASTKIWIKIPSIPTGSKTIYLYYGNLNASSASNFSATFPNSYILSSGSATLSAGNLNYDWFETASGTTLYTPSGNTSIINARVIKIAGTINGTGRGYGGGSGPGAGGSGGRGGGYGGTGGCPGYGCSCSGGGTYGTQSGTDISVGSGGGNSCCSPAGSGGGGIGLIGSRIVRISGTIFMNGTNGASCNCNAAGGGSGGGILIQGMEVNLSGAILQAIGGNGGSDTVDDRDSGFYECGGGGGAGGRIKIFYSSSYSAPSSISVSGGAGGRGYGGGNGSNGQTGTTYTGTFSSPEPTTAVGGEDILITQAGSPASWSWKIPGQGEKIRSGGVASWIWKTFTNDGTGLTLPRGSATNWTWGP